ncbi:MAG: hypothetical protein ACHQ50_09970 [Fimbriimonadales bacterium]
MSSSSLRERVRELIPYAPDLSDYDLRFRPTAYWANPVAAMLSTIKADYIGYALAARGLREGLICGPLGDLAPENQFALEEVHPALMAGAYLPDFGDWEVEIVRIVMASVTRDVISFRASPLDGGIGYRVVDEYTDEGEVYLFEEPTSAVPLSFGELLVLIATTRRSDYDEHYRPPASVIDLGKVLDARRFLTFRSAYYRDLAAFFRAEDDNWEASTVSRD